MAKNTVGKAKGGKGKATVAPKVETALGATPDAPTTVVKAEPTPAERFAADVSRRNTRGTLTTGQMTFTRNKASEIGHAALACGFSRTDAVALLGSRYSLDDTTLDALTRKAEEIRNVNGRKTPYYAKKGYARFAFNEGAPALTWAQAEPVIRETIDALYDAAERAADAANGS